MERQNKFMIMISVIAIAGIIISVYSVQAATITFNGLRMPNGTIINPTLSGFIDIGMGKNMKIIAKNSSSFTIIGMSQPWTSPSQRVVWNSNLGKVYFDDQMELSSQLISETRLMQLSNGNLYAVTIQPIYNNQPNPIVIKLYDNEHYTGESIIIPAGSTAGINDFIGYEFESGDVLNWSINENDPNGDKFIFNFREVIKYHITE